MIGPAAHDGNWRTPPGVAALMRAQFTQGQPGARSAFCAAVSDGLLIDLMNCSRKHKQTASPWCLQVSNYSSMFLPSH
jgi:hypothetical protein